MAGGLPFCQQVRFTHSHNISKWHPGSRGGGGGETGSAKRKWFVTLKSSFTIYKKEDVRLSLKHQYRCMYCCQTGGIEVSSCLNVYM